MMKVGMKNKAMAAQAQRENAIQIQGEVRGFVAWRCDGGFWNGVDGEDAVMDGWNPRTILAP
jgi:hypothetical protein